MMRLLEIIGGFVIVFLVSGGVYYWLVFRPVRQAAREVRKQEILDEIEADEKTVNPKRRHR